MSAIKGREKKGRKKKRKSEFKEKWKGVAENNSYLYHQHSIYEPLNSTFISDSLGNTDRDTRRGRAGRKNGRKITYDYGRVFAFGREKEEGKGEGRERSTGGKGKYRVFRDFLTQIISTIRAKNGVHRGEREQEKTRDRNCFAVPGIICRAIMYHLRKL